MIRVSVRGVDDGVGGGVVGVGKLEQRSEAGKALGLEHLLLPGGGGGEGGVILVVQALAHLLLVTKRPEKVID